MAGRLPSPISVNGDESHMNFHFPLMASNVSWRLADGRSLFPIIDILEQTPPIPDTVIGPCFLRNHDEPYRSRW